MSSRTSISTTQEDAAMCKTKDTVDMITFDLQQSTNIVFYKRQMWTYNFGVHDCSNDMGSMYMWLESIASRGSKEVISCLNKHLQKPSSATELIVFSDACGGQNRNINVAFYWIHVVCTPKYSYTTVNHKFMVSGHSYLPNDRDFGSIEKANRKQHVYIPEEWCKLVESCRRKNPFNVTRMDTKDFVSTSNHRTHIVYRKVNTAKEKVEWLKIRWMQFNNDTPFQLRYRYVNTLNLSLLLPFPLPFLPHSLSPSPPHFQCNRCTSIRVMSLFCCRYSHNTLETWKVLDIKRKQPGRPVESLSPLYTGPLSLNVNKLQDLQQLLAYIPPVHHDFYNALTSSPTAHTSSESDSEPDD